MKKINNSQRVVSLIISILVLLSSISPCLTVTAYETDNNASGASGITANFSANFQSGATYIGGKYVWDADSSAKDHRFIYRLTYSFSGTGYLNPGEVVFTVPKHILRNRKGVYDDYYDIAAPHKSQVTSDSEFYYEQYGDSVRITSNIRLSAGQSGYIDIGYDMGSDTFQYEDMCGSDTFHAQMSVNGSTLSASAPPCYVNTGAKIKSVQKYGCIMCRRWDEDWGAKPADADDYYYLVWAVATQFDDVTQPYTFTLRENFNHKDAEVIGYKFNDQEQFTANNFTSSQTLGANTINGQTMETIRYDFVLIRFKRTTYDNLKKYNFTNSITAVVTPEDGLDTPATATSNDSYVYEIAKYKRPTGHFYTLEYGNDDWYDYNGYYWDIADYGLDDLRDGKVDSLAGNIHFESMVYGYPYPWTVADGRSLDDPYAYGEKDVNYILTNDSFYLNENISTNAYGDAIRDPSARKLTSDDFEITDVILNFELSGAEYDDVYKEFNETYVEPTSSDVAFFYGKFGKNDSWVEIGSYNLGTGDVYYDVDYVESLDPSRIVFKSNCVGYKITFSNHYYYTKIDTQPYIKLKRSSYVLGQIGSKKKIRLTNLCTGQVYDYKNKLIFQLEKVARDFIVGVEKVSYIKENFISEIEHPSDKSVSLGWRIDTHESYRTNDGVECTVQDSGTFYVLLPYGCSVNPENLMVSASQTVSPVGRELDESEYDVSTQINYKNSGRTLLTVHIKQSAKNYSLYVVTDYSWADIFDYGYDIRCSVAYKTGNSTLADAYPDNGGKITDRSILANLDPNSDARLFLYDEQTHFLNAVTASLSGLTKTVKAEEDSAFSTSTVTHQNGNYMYKLRYATSDSSRSNNMIMFDSLENFVTSDGSKSAWHGTLQYVDVSHPKSMGIKPTVYYSKIKNLDIEANSSLSSKINGQSVWLTQSQIGNIGDATAIAVDLRYSSSGGNFVLEPNKSVTVSVYMKAPGSEPSGSGNSPAKAYNNVYISHNLINYGGTNIHYLIHQDYTEISLRVMADVKLHKFDTKDPDKPVKGISFCLEGTSDYGTGVYKILTTDRYGNLTFKNVEKGEYTLYEYEGMDDYQLLTDKMHVVVSGSGSVTIDGKSSDSSGYFLVGNKPRIHTDVQFTKKDIVYKDEYILGATFKLSGTSDYGNKIVMYAKAEDYGIVTFKNVELGTYTMVETETDENHILSNIKYTVRVDENSNFSISDSERGLNGALTIYNEPYHHFYIQKVSATTGYPVRGATFTLKGTSDYGTFVNLEKTSPTDGIIMFDKLEPGNYVLQETAVDGDYVLDDTKRVVTITPDDVVTIDGLSKNDMGYFEVENKLGGDIVITKKWVDNIADSARPTPVIHVSSEIPNREVYFNGSPSASYLSNIANISLIKGFAKWTGDESVALNKIASLDAVKIDDNSTPYSIYAWLSNGTVYWWSDCANV
ncbi:MAG: hypothetical protein II931_03360, partial [Clostridia bacterium]|nr:hypothetical protein [Clostridia bacterium]